ncbi:biliverdin-producing heme oxygenase [Paraburkholderia sp. PREW-6R]|uniref:biliverdin-producing heme oxygenase n=1 Tax=Paraburkholderia sp. PREW-6R TaxID=3141544 RepID=UPI0031F4EE34
MFNPIRLIDTSATAGRSTGEEGGVSGEAPQAAHVLAAVRASTARRHELLHEIMPLSVDSVELHDYLAHLVILRHWLEPLEPWLASFDDGPQAPAHRAARVASDRDAHSFADSTAARSPVIPHANPAAQGMTRLALIAADLAHESVSARERADLVSLVSAARGWSGVESAAYRWGVCYVIEGSQLGGAVLYAKLKDRLAPHPLGYLSAGRASLGPRWQAFVRAMCDEVQGAAGVEEACRGAADAFDRLIELAGTAPRATRAICASAD